MPCPSQTSVFNVPNYVRKRKAKNERGVVVNVRCDGRDLIPTSDGTVKIVLSEEAQNKDIKIIYREALTRKSSRKNTMTDLVNNLLISSDPLISNIIKSHKKHKTPLWKEGLQLLKDSGEEEEESVIHEENVSNENVKPERKEVVYTFEVKNSGGRRNQSVVLKRLMLLHPYEAFQITDPLNISDTSLNVSGISDDIIRMGRLHPGSSYNVTVTFTNSGTTAGTYGVPVCFTFAHSEESEKEFDIIRMMVVNVTATDHGSEQAETQSSPFTGEAWSGMDFTVYGSMPDGEVRAVEIKLDSLPDPEAQLLRDKFQNVFGKNSGYKKMCKVAQVLEDVPVDEIDGLHAGDTGELKSELEPTNL
ncbi:hypothetical protein ANN_17430 [Periplaneta americana]|uniref:Helicase MOV-10 Ig-like domain-containing protein n=1 Tax=Periplaneta americana TaxID=6978 RepID=A0ABQ8SSX5_PERAM|nr:hypothetical protein ANN_17430 [Periplaneta americana]